MATKARLSIWFRGTEGLFKKGPPFATGVKSREVSAIRNAGLSDP
jgi:hypothetical protein